MSKSTKYAIEPSSSQIKMTKDDQKRKFLEAARELGADEDPDAFKERLKKLVKQSLSRLKSERIKKSAK